ncbi:MAG: hypothetical protein H9W81_14960 [Enterococcus sp.]|nr:hypothetical protein [Enterococcus sp.]
MQNKYYTYMHLYKNKILTFGVGTYYINRKTHKQRYERAYQKSNRGYQDVGINYKDVEVYVFGNFDTKKEAEMYETYLHDAIKKGINLIRNRDKTFKILSQSQVDAYKSVSNKHKKKVRCINTGEEFNSIEEASKKFNIHRSRISEQLTYKIDSCINPDTKERLKFEYVVKS